jgi:uncharacterized protein YcfJ
MKIVSRFLAVAMIASSMTTAASIVVPTEAMAASKSYCKAYAKRQANRRAGAPQVVTGAVVGAGIGALAGLAFGGHHAVRNGALIGAGGGAVVGGVNANGSWRRIYNNAYQDCRYNM